MKRILTALSALILCAACVLSFVSCDGGNIDRSKDGIIGDSNTGDGTDAMSDSKNDIATGDMTGNVTDNVTGSITDDGGMGGGESDAPADSSGDGGDMSIGGSDDSGVNEGIPNSLDPRLGITTDGDDRVGSKNR